MIRTTLDALLIGTPVPLPDGRARSAIGGRRATADPIMLRADGLVGDRVGDKRFHGGADKAVHFYPADHYPWWRERFSDAPQLAHAGAFGENLSALGLTEDVVSLGDRFAIGGAVVEVSHGRQPCNTINRHFGRPDIMATIFDQGRGGYYFRVIQEGEVRAGDAIEQIATGDPDWSVARLFAVLYQGAHKADWFGVETLAEHPLLAEAWRARARSLLKGRKSVTI